MKYVKKILGVLVFTISIFTLTTKVSAIDTNEYWKADTFKVNDTLVSSTSTYNNETITYYPTIGIRWEKNEATDQYEATDKGELYLQQYMSREDEDKFTMNFKAYNLNDSKNYTLNLKSDFIDESKTYTGKQLKDGIVVTIEDAKGSVAVTLKEENANNIVKYRQSSCDSMPEGNECIEEYEVVNMLDPVIILFDDQKPTPKIDALFNKIAPEGVIKLNAVNPGNVEYSDSMITAGLKEYAVDGYDLYGYIYEGKGKLTIAELKENEAGEYKTYNVKYEYVEPDQAIKNKVDTVKNKLKVNIDDLTGDYNKRFIVEDLDSINYLYNVQRTKNEIAAINSIVNYSSKIHELAGNVNIDFLFDVRAGGGESEFSEMTIGPMNIVYDGIIYDSVDPIGYSLTQIIYIPNDTEKTRDAFINAAKTRIQQYLKGIDVEITYGGKIADLDEVQYSWEKYIPEQREYVCEPLFDMNKTNGEWYKVKIGKKEYKYFIVQDSDKMSTPYVKTVDSNTNIYVMTDAFDAPLDSRINVNKLDKKSDEYKELMTKLNVIEGIAYDLNLYSTSLDMYVSKLSDGNFKVYIPVDEETAKKQLVALYLKEDGTIEEHPVTIENGYAVFETNHFSTYTITEKTETPAKEETKTETNTINNPKTVDNIIRFVSLLSISSIGLVSLGIYTKKNKITK